MGEYQGRGEVALEGWLRNHSIMQTGDLSLDPAAFKAVVDELVPAMFNLQAADMERISAAFASQETTSALVTAISQYLAVWSLSEWKDYDNIYFVGRRIGRIAYSCNTHSTADIVEQIAKTDKVFEAAVLESFERGLEDGFSLGDSDARETGAS
jgi:hypothetical protein